MKNVIRVVLILFSSISINAQEGKISGTVTLATDGLPLPGVSVVVKGTTRGVQTDFDGKYEIKAFKGDVLVFAYVSMKTEEIIVGTSNTIDIAMEVDTDVLEEVVISAYSSTKKSYAVSSVLQAHTSRKSKKSKSQTLAGQVSGLNITMGNCQVGNDVTIILRDNASINGQNRPLFILNGKTIDEKKFRKIKSKKIKDVKVLKGEMAKDKYGFAGLNGAIEITTRGKKGNTDLSVIDDFFNESYARIHENNFERTSLAPLSTFSIDVDRASYSNIRRMINNGQRIMPDAVKIEEMINYFNYSYPQPTGEHPFSINTEVVQTPWNNDTHLVRIGLQGKTYDNDKLPASNLTFLIDVSGSMGAINKLPLLKAAFKLLVNQLRAKDKVSIVVYAGAAGVVLESTSGIDKNRIIQALDHLKSGGSTAGGQGIEMAYKLAEKNFIKGGNNRIILATDGDFNVGISNDSAMQTLIEEKRKTGVFLSVLGFGYGNYKDSKLETLADKGNGNHAYIDNMQEAQKVFGKEYGGTLFTIAKDVKIQVEFNPKKVQAYRLIGYENRLLADEDFIDDTKDAGELGSGHTVTALYEIIPVGIKSSYLKKVNNLKYTEQEVSNTFSDELLTVKFRYKKPNASRSIEIVHVQKAVVNDATQDMNFASAVALFSMQLRDSKYFNNVPLTKVVELAEQGRGNDKDGYRSEFIRLVKSYNKL